MDLISRVEMKYHSNPLQEKLRMDKQMIRNCKDLIISADKTGNFYQVDPKEYQKYLKNTITKDYQKVNESVLENINNEAANIASKLQLDDRIDAMGLNQGYITIKDHKTTFPNRLDFRLINPCKSQIGKISKKILKDINARVRDSTMVCQWRSTGEMLEWFRSLKEKKKLSFVQYDIEAFYPSITKDLLMQSINYAKSITIVKDEEIDIILHARKSVLATDGDVWMKKDCPEFDVTMGGLDGAEVCETTGLYLLHRLQEIIEKEKSGLYRDDGLLVVEGGGQKAERMKKKLFSLFKSVGLKITAEANLKSVNFLDVNLDLADGTFKPFMKPNSKVKYVSRESNHPPLILKHIPEAVNERLERVSSCKQKFEEELLTYQKALTEAGYNHSLNYMEKVVDKSNITQDTHKRKRSRQVIWFNPPYSSNVKTNIGKVFFCILKKHFPNDCELLRLYNKKSV